MAYKEHGHDFQDCGYDEQQCDRACQATSHFCSTCGKSREDVAKDPDDAKQHVVSSVQSIIAELMHVEQFTTLTESVKMLETCSKKLSWLAHEQLVEMVVWRERSKLGSQ